MALSKKMRTTLEALNLIEGGLYPGTSVGEIEAAGGSRVSLGTARRKGWANKYPASSSGMRDVPTYYLTTAGAEALREDQEHDG